MMAGENDSVVLLLLKLVFLIWFVVAGCPQRPRQAFFDLLRQAHAILASRRMDVSLSHTPNTFGGLV